MPAIVRLAHMTCILLWGYQKDLCHLAKDDERSECVLDRQDKELPACLDMFGWCTWDAYYFRVSAQGIMEGLKSFKQGGVQPRFLVIDDGELRHHVTSVSATSFKPWAIP